MTIYYLTKEGEMLDLICWKHYGFTDGVVELAVKDKI
ncbi:tail protein X [Wolbachia endosymbiont (group A) of Nomada hirtipes]